MLEDAIERFDAIALRWIEDAVEVKPSSVPPVLYHYTDAAGLYGMLTSGKVWLTDYRFLNDKTEIIHTANVAGSVIRGLIDDNPDSIANSLYAQILKRIDIEPQFPFLLFSLSEDGDDLSQWRGYARDGQGFTIGFDGSVLQRSSTGRSGYYQFSKVEYDHAKQTDALVRALSEMEIQLRKEISDKPEDVEALTRELSQSFGWVVHNRGSVNKHSSFKAEQEWRLLEYIGKPGLALKVRASGTRLIPYSELCPCPDTNKLPIKRIGIGPSLSGIVDVHAVKALCDQTGYDVEVYLANAPYRRL